MKKLLALGVLVALLGVADVAARSLAEDRIAAKVQASAQGAVGASADIESFPFLVRLGASGEVPRIQVRIDRLQRERLEFANFVLDLEQVRFDRDALLGGRVEVRGITRGAVSIEVDASALGRVLGETVRIDDGKVSVTVAGRTVEGQLEVVEGPALRLRVASLPPVTLRLPIETLMPCTPTLLFLGSTARLSCSFDEVPQALLRAAADATAEG